MKLVHEKTFEKIAYNMTDSQIGAKEIKVGEIIYLF